MGYKCQAGFTSLWKRGGVLFGNFPATREVRLQSPQLLQPKTTRDVCQAVIETQQNHLIVPLSLALPLPDITTDAMIAEASQRLGKFCISRSHHSALTRGQVFDWVEAEHRHVRNAADAPVPIFRA